MRTITKDEAIKIAIKEFNGYSIKFLEENNGVFVFLCSAQDKEQIPDKIVTAINKNTGKIGYSIISIEDAIKSSKR